MKITVFVKGKSLPSYYADAVGEYIKRLSPYCRSSLVTYDAFADIQARLLRTYVIEVTKGKSSFTSVLFADMLGKLMLDGISSLSFVIGEEGLSFPRIALTSMSAGNGMMTYLLYEQLYRAFMINTGHPYHK